MSGLLAGAVATQMLRLTLVNRPMSIRHPSQWVATAVKEALNEADSERFEKSEWGQQFRGGVGAPASNCV